MQYLLPMFLGFAVYVGDKIVFMLRDRTTAQLTARQEIASSQAA
jgi:hypothetical protein